MKKKKTVKLVEDWTAQNRNLITGFKVSNKKKKF